MDKNSNMFKELFGLFDLKGNHREETNVLVNEFNEAVNAFNEKKAREIIDTLKNEGYDVNEFEIVVNKVFAKASL